MNSWKVTLCLCIVLAESFLPTLSFSFGLLGQQGLKQERVCTRAPFGGRTSQYDYNRCLEKSKYPSYEKKAGTSFSVLSFSSSSSTTESSGISDDFNASTSSSSDSELKSVPSMRVAELRSELQERGIDFKDCFDKESLVARLQDARTGVLKSTSQKRSSDGSARQESSSSSSPAQEQVSTDSQQPTAAKETSTINRQTTASTDTAEIGKMTIKELRQELASRNIRWAGLMEKSDLVRAVQEARQTAAHFSVTGLLTPGQVTSLTAEQVRTELTTTATPLLLDVFAVWCGPCQLMATQLQEVAKEFGANVRVAKMDSDENPQLSSELRVKGLPTLILFDSNGKEIDRIEGAMMKDQLIQWVQSKM